MRRISLVTETFLPDINGVANTLGYLMNGLLERGIHVQLVHPLAGPAQLPATSQIEQLRVTGWPIPGYPDLRFGLPAYRRLLQAWRRQAPDAIYIATEGPLGWSALKAARRLHLPAVSGFHTNFHQYSRHYAPGLGHLVNTYLRRFHNRTLRTLVPTQRQRQQLLADGYQHVEVLSRGVDGTLFSPSRRNERLRTQWGLPPQQQAVLYVGRLAPEKNLDLLTKAFTHMQTVNPQTRLIVVGDGPLKETLQRQHPNAIFCGMQRGEELATHYASADIFLFPSETETFGNVVIEAMASGLPVVAYDYAAAHSHIRHGHNGLLAPYGDAAAFIEQAASLVRQPGRARQLGRQAWNDAQALHWDQIVSQFIEFLTITPQEARAHENSENRRSVP